MEFLLWCSLYAVPCAVDISLLPQWQVGSVLLLATLGMLGWPFIERAFSRPLKRTLLMALGAVLLVSWLLLSIYGARVA